MKLIVGLRGSGKTKALVEMVNAASATSKGNVICIEFGSKLNFDIKPQARLIDCTAYAINSATSLYGFVAGILASNYDITDIFIDSALKICDYNIADLERFILSIDALVADRCNVTITISAADDEIPHSLHKFF